VLTFFGHPVDGYATKSISLVPTLDTPDPLETAEYIAIPCVPTNSNSLCFGNDMK